MLGSPDSYSLLASSQAHNRIQGSVQGWSNVCFYCQNITKIKKKRMTANDVSGLHTAGKKITAT